MPATEHDPAIHRSVSLKLELGLFRFGKIELDANRLDFLQCDGAFEILRLFSCEHS
jgi:hypothetical protein